MIRPILLVVIIGLLLSCNHKPFKNLKGEPIDIVILPKTKAVVYFFLVSDCPFSQYYTMAISQVYSQFYNKGFQFFGIVPGNLYSLKEISSFHSNYNFKPQIVLDNNYILSHKYNVAVVPQVLVTDKKGNVLYTGKIDDQAIQAGQKKYQATQFYLLNALKSIYKGKPIAIKKTEAVGCFIE